MLTCFALWHRSLLGHVCISCCFSSWHCVKGFASWERCSVLLTSLYLALVSGSDLLGGVKGCFFLVSFSGRVGGLMWITLLRVLWSSPLKVSVADITTGDSVDHWFKPCSDLLSLSLSLGRLCATRTCSSLWATFWHAVGLLNSLFLKTFVNLIMPLLFFSRFSAWRVPAFKSVNWKAC